jgi:hypothetical protein
VAIAIGAIENVPAGLDGCQPRVLLSNNAA